MNLLEPFSWALLLMFIGVVLVILELFIPSGGILGALATLALVVGISFAFYSRGPGTGLIFVLVTAIGLPLIISGVLKYLPMTPLGRAFLGELPDENELIPEDDRKVLLGRVGIARSKMLPSGAVEIDGRIIDAVTKGISIEPGEPVVVCEVSGNRVIVRPAEKNEPIRGESPKEMLEKPMEELRKDFDFESIDDSLT